MIDAPITSAFRRIPHHTMRLTPFAPSRRRALALAAAPIALALAAFPPSAPARAATGTAVPDPSVGPNTHQEQLLGGSRPALAPDPRLRPLDTSQHTVTRAAVPPAKVASGNSTLTREVFGFAPSWELGDWSEWQLNLLSTVAYFGVNFDGNG